MKSVESFRFHTLKTWPDFYRAILAGDKTFEARVDDRHFKEGDVLILQEFEPNYVFLTGAESKYLVTYALRGPAFGVEKGWIVMSIKPVTTFAKSCMDCGYSFQTYDTAHTHCQDCL